MTGPSNRESDKQITLLRSGTGTIAAAWELCTSRNKQIDVWLLIPARAAGNGGNSTSGPPLENCAVKQHWRRVPRGSEIPYEVYAGAIFPFRIGLMGLSAVMSGFCRPIDR